MTTYPFFASAILFCMFNSVLLLNLKSLLVVYSSGAVRHQNERKAVVPMALTQRETSRTVIGQQNTKYALIG